MPILLEGGCRVSRLREGGPEERGSLRVFRHVDRTTGASAISLRVLEFAPGLSPTLANASCDEVLFVLAGQGAVRLDGRSYAVGPETGIYLRPRATLAVEVDPSAPGPLAMPRPWPRRRHRISGAHGSDSGPIWSAGRSGLRGPIRPRPSPARSTLRPRVGEDGRPLVPRAARRERGQRPGYPVRGWNPARPSP
jgi:mannose-6-phosphate isomerase-like protein (cupin superfamily)